MTQRKHSGIEERNELVHEFAPVGRYRVRLLRDKDDGELYLDVREYLAGGKFEGFTRRGVRLVDVKEIEALQSDLIFVIDRWKKEEESR